MQRTVGDHIQGLPARHGESERRVWTFISSFTENKMDGDKLQKLYAKLKANKAAPSGKCLAKLHSKIGELAISLMGACLVQGCRLVGVEVTRWVQGGAGQERGMQPPVSTQLLPPTAAGDPFKQTD